MQNPTTRESMLIKLSDPAHVEAWGEFSAVYRPIIVRVAQARGVQFADADDLAQEVMTAVSRRISSFKSTGEGSFRRWLYQITRNLVVNHLTRGKEPLGSGNSNIQQMLLQKPAPGSETATLFELEVRRFQFQQTADQLAREFSDDVWKAFWLTAVESLSIDDAAQRLGKSKGAVRVARCRVLARFREVVAEQEVETNDA